MLCFRYAFWMKTERNYGKNKCNKQKNMFKIKKCEISDIMYKCKSINKVNWTLGKLYGCA